MRHAVRSIPLCAAQLLGLALCTSSVQSQETRIYVANDDMTDYIWSADEAGYRTIFLEMLDYYLNQADSTDSLSSDFQARFNADGHLWLSTYQHNRSAVQFQRLISRIADGHITIPLQALAICYGAMPAEAVIRSMYYPGRIERQYHIPFELACAMENQTLQYGLPSLWAGAGAKYSWKGVCGCVTHVTGLGNRGREVYYAAGPDGRSILLKWHSLYGGTVYGGNQHSGGYAENREVGPAAMARFGTTDSTFLARYPYPKVVGFFGWGWDNVYTNTNIFTLQARLASLPGLRVIVSNELDFFKDLESSAPPRTIPSYSAGFGNEWDLYCASMAEVTASVKRSVEALRGAEALATYAGIVDPGFMTGRAAGADSAFTNLGLYYEHTWTADGPYSYERPAYQRRLSAQISGYVSTLRNDAITVLSKQIICPQASTRFCVFNPLGWARMDIADLPYAASGPVRVVDVETGVEVRNQSIVVGGQQFLRILAGGVPATGYRVYEVQSGTPSMTDTAATFSNNGSTFENDKYRITVSGNGAITSMVDKRSGSRQIVQSIGGLAMNDLGNGSGTPVAENIGPVSATIFVDAGGTPLHRARITLYHTVDRVDIDDEITSNFGDAITSYSFGFNISGYAVRHEEVGAIVVAKTLSAGGNYSDDRGRYDWFTMNHFVDLSNSQWGVTLSNWESPFFKLGNTSGTTIDVITPRVRALIGGRIDPPEGIANQNGDSHFRNRYALQVHGAYNQAAAMRMSLEHQNPLIAFALTANSTGRFPEAGDSLVSIADSSVLLWALKPSEEGIGSGIIVRVWNLDEQAHPLLLTCNEGSLSAASKTTHIETDLSSISTAGSSITDSLPAQWMQTYRLTVNYEVASVKDAAGRPEFTARLVHCYPNPFNPSTKITFELDQAAHITLKVFDVLGQEVATIASGMFAGGSHSFAFNPGSLGLASGVYICRLAARPGSGGPQQQIVRTEKMAFIK